MLALKINDSYVNSHLAKQSRLQGKSRQRVATEMLHKQIEDAEDYAAAMISLQDPAPSRPIAELWRQLGLED